VPQVRPSPSIQRRGLPESGRFRDTDGHTMWLKGGTREHNPEWCGACLLANKIKDWLAKKEEETESANNEAEPDYTADP
jgi:hypothetical protein